MLHKQVQLIVKEKLSPGDIGYITYMHGKIYSEEYNYSRRFEEDVAHSLIQLSQNCSNQRNRIWILRNDDTIVGTLGIVVDQMQAQLRWFLLESDYRGSGYGSVMIDQAISYCRSLGLDSIKLYTTSDLVGAQKLYIKHGFVLVDTKRKEHWKHGLVEMKYFNKLQK